MVAFKVLLLLVCALLLATLAAPAHGSSLQELDESMTLLEAEASVASSGASAIAAAQAYADKKVAGAVKASKTIVKDAKKAAVAAPKKAAPAAAKKAAAAPAKKAAAPAKPAAKPVVKAAVKAKIAKEAKAEAKSLVKKLKAEIKATKPAGGVAPKKKRSSFKRGQGLTANRQGVFGAVDLGLSKAESVPTALSGPKGRRTPYNKRSPTGEVKRDMYGQKKGCLKDIAAHFDEQDVYESKKQALLTKLDRAKNEKHAQALHRKLANLETWHQMMQKKFLQSAAEAKEHGKKVAKLFDAHLPAELKQQLAANKAAKRAVQKLPYPDAQRQAIAFLRKMRTKLSKDARLRTHGHKVMVRPEISDPGFPSMDPISSNIRERRWRQIITDEKWSTDDGDLETSGSLVKEAHKVHGDFMDGPIAEPLLRGKQYNAKTEPLGVPHFLTNFPWPKAPNDHISMNEKQRVEQTDYTTY